VDAVGHRAHALGDPLLVLRDDQFEANLAGDPIPVLDHLAELPLTVHVHAREWEGTRVECLACEMDEDRGILADGIHQEGAGEGSRGLPQDAYRLRLECVENVVRRDHGQDLRATIIPAEQRNMPRHELSDSRAI
jgi:hypothetical protein